MTVDVMAMAVSLGMIFGIVLKFTINLLYFCISKIIGWLQLKS